jgi:hypothetical protein
LRGSEVEGQDADSRLALLFKGVTFAAGEELDGQRLLVDKAVTKELQPNDPKAAVRFQAPAFNNHLVRANWRRMQRFREPVHADRGSEHAPPAFDRLAGAGPPQKWTLTQPRKLQQFRQVGGSLIGERTATFREGTNTCNRALPTPSIASLAGTISGTVKTRPRVA